MMSQSHEKRVCMDHLDVETTQTADFKRWRALHDFIKWSSVLTQFAIVVHGKWLEDVFDTSAYLPSLVRSCFHVFDPLLSQQSGLPAPRGTSATFNLVKRLAFLSNSAWGPLAFLFFLASPSFVASLHVAQNSSNELMLAHKVEKHTNGLTPLRSLVTCRRNDPALAAFDDNCLTLVVRDKFESIDIKRRLDPQPAA